MTEDPAFAQARTISLDFDGVLSTLVLGRAWEKTRAGRPRVPLITPLVRGLKTAAAAMTEGFRRPFPQADEVLRGLRASQLTLYVLTSRTGERIGAAERWLAKYGWRELFERLFFNVAGEDADAFKARVLGATAIDLHIDDDAETLALLAPRFPEKRFVHMNCYNRKSPSAGNIAAVRSWRELAALLSPAGGPRA